MVRISAAKKKAKQAKVVIPFSEACPITRLRSPSGRLFVNLTQEDVSILMRLGWTYDLRDEDAS